MISISQAPVGSAPLKPYGFDKGCKHTCLVPDLVLCMATPLKPVGLTMAVATPLKPVGLMKAVATPWTPVGLIMAMANNMPLPK